MSLKTLETICLPIIIGTVLFVIVNGIIHCCHVGGFWGTIAIVLTSLSLIAGAALLGADAVS